MTIISDIFKAALDLYLDVAIYMLFGFFVAGVLHAFFKADRIKKTLGTGKIRPVILSALFGIPIPLCSCGVVPVATSLKKQGANSGAALSFMIATPESGVDSIAVSWAMLDPLMTVIRPVAGFITALATGIAQNFIGKETPAMPAAAFPTCGCGLCLRHLRWRQRQPVPQGLLCDSAPLERIAVRLWRTAYRYCQTLFRGDSHCRYHHLSLSR